MSAKALVYHNEPVWWKEITRKARIVWESIRDEKLPDLMMKCKTPTDTRAKKCAHSDACWLRRFKFDLYVKRGKELAEKEGRKLLDLSTWKAAV